MTTFLPWNVHRRKLDGHIVRLVQRHKVDVLLLVEHPKPDKTLFSQLNTVDTFQRVPSHDRFSVYVNFDVARMERIAPPVASDRVDFWNISLSRRNKVLLALVHGLDIPNNPDPEKRSLFFERLAKTVLLMERKTGHKNSVVAGDFNANPFEPIVGGIRGLHAIRVRDVGGKMTRSVLNEDYEFFYNPMWSCYKGWEEGPPATHYFNGSDVHEVFWHMLDQVVLRPQALYMFSEKSLRVLTEAGNTSLLTKNGLPDEKNVSDHLPVLFKLNLTAKVKNG
jgi:hypothetical protein